MEKKQKMTSCKTCGKEIAASAKICPNCGGKNKKPIFKRPWFIVLAVIVLIGIICAAGGSNNLGSEDKGEKIKDKEVEQNIEYTAYDVDTLVDDLETNALKAKEKYDGSYVALSGKLSNIDSDGDYISIKPSHKDFSIYHVQCYINNDEQLDKIMEMEIGHEITVKGKIKSVGEVLGYSLDITSIE